MIKKNKWKVHSLEYTKWVYQYNGTVYFSPSCPDPGPREKINLNVYFHTPLWNLNRFYEDLKGYLRWKTILCHKV